MYQLMKEHEKTFEIKHPDGSSFHVAKSAVGPEVHKRIKALKMAEGGKVPEDNTLKDSDPTIPEDQSEGGKSLRNFLGLEQEAPAVMPPAGTSFDEYNAQASIPGVLPQAPPIEAPADMNRATGGQMASPPVPQASISSAPIPSQTSAAPTASNPLDPSAILGAQNKALDTQQAAIKQNADVQQKEYQLQAKKELDYAKQVDQAEADVKKITDPWRAENDQLYKAIREEKVDPNRLWNNMSTGNKIGASLGILLSGIGAGLQGPGARNMAMDVIDKTIDRDIEGQKLELGKKQTLFSENLRRIGDERSAAALTKSQMLTSLQAMTHSSMARINSAQAQAEGQRLSTEIDLKRQGLQNEAAIRTMAMQGGAGDPSMLVSHLVPKEHQKAVFDEIERAQDTKRMGGSILNAFDEAAKENTVMKTGAGLLRTPGSVYALHQAMQPTFKDLEGTVRQAAMDNTFKNITPAPGDSEHTQTQKRQALEQYLQSKASAPTAKGFGIDLDKFGTTNSKPPAQEVERMDPKSGKIVIYDANTKQPLRYK